MLLPANMWQCFWDKGLFPKYILHDAKEISTFWSQCRIAGYHSRCIPLVLHGDGAAVTQQLGSGSKSCLFVSFRSLLANQSTYFDGCALDKLLHQNTVRQHWSQSFQSVGQLFPVLARQNGFTREEHGAIVVKRTCTRVKS